MLLVYLYKFGCKITRFYDNRQSKWKKNVFFVSFFVIIVFLEAKCDTEVEHTLVHVCIACGIGGDLRILLVFLLVGPREQVIGVHVESG